MKIHSAAAPPFRERGPEAAALRTLLAFGVDSLPLSPYKIAVELGIAVCEYGVNAAVIRAHGFGRLLRADGFAFAEPDGRLLIAYNEDRPRQEIRFTLAHELGHILLGHVGPETPRGRWINPSDPELEPDADLFAVHLLAPACVLWELGLHTPEEIARVCDVPAEMVWRHASQIWARKEAAASPLERELCGRFRLSFRERTGSE